MKSIFILFFSISSFLSGFLIKYRQQNRIKNIGKLIILLENIATSIDFSMDDIDKIILSTSKNINLNFLNEFVFLDKNRNIKDRWIESINKTYFLDCFKLDEKNILFSFSNILGTTSKEGQIKNCKLHSELLKNINENLKLELTKKGNSSIVLGFLCALLIIIIFV